MDWSTVVVPDQGIPPPPPDIHVSNSTFNSTLNQTVNATGNSPAAFRKRTPVSHIKDFHLPIEKRGNPKSVDWRGRWGWQWTTSIQDQGGCGACWVFAAVALVEMQNRIEHGAWSKSSEADLHDMIGVNCAMGGGPSGALDWAIKDDRGIADPHCYPYIGTDRFYFPCGDRAGRSVRLPAYTWVASVDDQKRWLNNVGPLAACFTFYPDFYSWGFKGSSPYKWDGVTNSTGGHCVLIVGYDDNAGGWIFKNSWGTGFGNGGYGYFAYGSARIDDGPKLGISNLNPDPWAKKKHHNGILYESGNGATHRNYEMVRSNATGGFTHVYRQGEAPNKWAVVQPVFELNATSGKPIDGSTVFGQPVITGTSFNRDYEVVYVSTKGTLETWHYSQNVHYWYYTTSPNFVGLTLRGYPGFVQMDDSSFCVVARTSTGALQELIRDAKTGLWSWGSQIAASGIFASGPSLVQSNVGLNIYDGNSRGNLYVVAVLNTGQLQLFWRSNAIGVSHAWKAGEVFGSGVSRATPPVMIQDYWGTADERSPGGFQLVVVVNGYVQHWQRINSNIASSPPVAGARGPWTQIRTYGNGHIKHVWSLVQGSFRGILDSVIEDFNGDMWHYQFVGDPGQWKLMGIVPGVRGGF
ncbi:hypothetical protein B0T24DRAFT_538893 [Lasiosphaeria ovina]|uniref:Peptidase C1A papain C-terminal domain-containing protein n=1 Tax=Lasiosphaeria ovina TaxID=92902 RepID=A0AAE0JTC9_9PEZI|nr:hypothetical protein B0T24DRAFT_538893 [Lasiosphaeria ovina]